MSSIGSAADYVQGLQRDGRLLLRVIARRPDRPLGSSALPGANLGSGQTVAAYSILTDEDPAAIAQSPNRMAILADCVDDLSRRVAPASAASIRLSSAYLNIPLEDGEPFPLAIVRRALWLRWGMRGIMFVAVATTAIAVLLLMHVDSGQRAVQQLQDARAEVAIADADLAKLSPEAWNPALGPDPSAPYCASASLVAPRPEGGRQPSATAFGAMAASICDRRYQAALRMDLVFLRLADWNCRTHRAYMLWGLRGSDGCGALPPPPPDPTPDAFGHWQRTEIRTAGSISILTGFVLPMLLACVGGCAYALRRLDHKLSIWALEFNDGSHSWVRVLLATMLGGLLGVIWTGNQPVSLGGFTLSIAAFAFFLGFSLEVVFTVIEAMVDGVAGKLHAAPLPIAFQIPAAQQPAGGGAGAGAQQPPPGAAAAQPPPLGAIAAQQPAHAPGNVGAAQQPSGATSQPQPPTGSQPPQPAGPQDFGTKQ